MRATLPLFFASLAFALLLALTPALGLAAPARAADVRFPEVPPAVRALLGETAGRRVADRIDAFSESLSGIPYASDPFGEGPGARYDSDPTSRFDAFDCTTFVETVLALARSSGYGEFRETLQLIRYRGGRISFQTRNHFPGSDWIVSNEEAGFLRDVTVEVAKGRHRIAEALADRRGWYGKMDASRIQVPGLSPREKEARAAELRSYGLQFEPFVERLPYIPLEAIFGSRGNREGGDPSLLDRIPHGAVINIVRPGWDLVPLIGTQLNISHQGFAIRRGGELLFRHSSSDAEEVTTARMADYLRSFLGHKTIRGINVLEPLEPR